MILLEDKKAIIITPPHTGSGALHRQLCGHPGRYWVISKSYDQFSDHHGATIQPSWVEHDGFKVYVMSRNPVERIAGLFNHFNWFRELNGFPAVSLRAFRTIIDNLSWFYNTSISSFVDDHVHYEHRFIGYHNAGSTFRRLFDIDLEWIPSTVDDDTFIEIANLFDDHELLRDITHRVA